MAKFLGVAKEGQMMLLYDVLPRHQWAPEWERIGCGRNAILIDRILMKLLNRKEHHSMKRPHCISEAHF
jgi:hypothetical protein